tara:strand:- start:468 stop:722 length:255 start_codon:yes stop_codon:yes gene_type:complete
MPFKKINHHLHRLGIGGGNFLRKPFEPLGGIPSKSYRIKMVHHLKFILGHFLSMFLGLSKGFDPMAHLYQKAQALRRPLNKGLP